MSLLTPELLALVLSSPLLAAKDLLRFGAVSKECARAAADELPWKALWRRTVPVGVLTFKAVTRSFRANVLLNVKKPTRRYKEWHYVTDHFDDANRHLVTHTFSLKEVQRAAYGDGVMARSPAFPAVPLTTTTTTTILREDGKRFAWSATPRCFNRHARVDNNQHFVFFMYMGHVNDAHTLLDVHNEEYADA
jgi:hypothetical protein